MIRDLLNPGWVAEESVAELREGRVLGTGRLWGDVTLPPPAAAAHAALVDGIRAVRRRLGRGPLVEEYDRYLAGELLLLHTQHSGPARALAAAAGLLELHPFSHRSSLRGPTLRELLAGRCAAVVAPLDTLGARTGPLLMQIWLVRPAPDAAPPEREDHRTLLQGGREFAEEHGCSLYLVPYLALPELGATGSSWRLGAELLRRVLEEAPHRARELAASWIVTGDVRGGQITAVEVTQKAELAEATAPRRWMLPLASREQNCLARDFGERLIGRHLFVRDRQTAWAAFTGYHTFELDLKPKAWPTPVDAVHALVSEALTPIVAPVLISPPRREAVFWLSPAMRGQEERIRRVLEIAAGCGLLEASFVKEKVRFREMESSTRGAGERALFDPGAGLVGGGEECILFNKTGGNDSMKTAAENVARLHAHVHLIYRDVSDETNSVFHEIHYTAQLSISERIDAGPLWTEWLAHRIPRDRPDEIIDFATTALPAIARQLLAKPA